MTSIFRRQPDAISSAYSESHLGRGADYHRNFSDLPGRALMWQMERRVLGDLTVPLAANQVVDFACGTGRITKLLHEKLPDANVVGLDISSSMIELAKRNSPDVRFECTDGRHLASRFPESSVDLVCAFRFFANAEPELRCGVADQFASVVRPGGYVLVNNHRNFWSSSYFSRRVKSDRAPGCLNREVTGLFRERGFEVAAHRSLGLLPQSDDRSYLASWRLTERLELANCDRTSAWHRAGLNTVWLFRRKA